jgi:hypothetical protein
MKYLILAFATILQTVGNDGSNFGTKNKDAKELRNFATSAQVMGEERKPQIVHNYARKHLPEVSPDGTLVVYNGERTVRISKRRL